jgi:hypothetical protein
MQFSSLHTLQTFHSVGKRNYVSFQEILMIEMRFEFQTEEKIVKITQLKKNQNSK